MLFSANLCAQAPQSFSYQAVMRGANNELVVNKPVGMKISLLQGSEKGKAVYVETHKPTSNENGLVSIAIGGGTKEASSTAFASIDWSKGPYFVQTETDVSGGTSYSLTSVSQLLSVPYAMYAGNSLPAGGKQGHVITFCDGVARWTKDGVCPGKIESIDCINAKINGVLNVDDESDNLSFDISYINGNGGFYNSISTDSKGVTGLVAKLKSGYLANGDSVLNFSITGIPKISGNAEFSFSIDEKNCSVFIPVTLSNNTLIDFEEFVINANSFIEKSSNGFFTSKNCSFSNKYNIQDNYLVSGFAVSTKNDTTTQGYTNLHSAYAGVGARNSKVYLSGWGLDSTYFKLPINRSLISFEVTNSTYAALSMKNGDSFAKKFVKGDYFKLIVKGYSKGVEKTRVEVYLADFRSENTNEHFIQKNWKKIPTPYFDNIDEVRFNLESSDNGQWGMNTPACFVLDNLVIK